MLYRLVEETRWDLIELLIIKMNIEGEVEEGQLPQIN